MKIKMLLSIIFLPISYIILNIWIWLFENIFGLEKNKNKIIIITIIMGLIAGLSIIYFPKIVTFFGINQMDFTQNTNNFQNQFIFFGLYLSIPILILNFIMSGFKISKLFITNFIIFLIFFFIIGFFGENIIVNSALKYYLFVALGEEFIKFLLSIIFYDKYKFTKSDILIFSILSAIGFAFIENFVYLFSILTGNENNIIGYIIGGLSILITRGLVGFLVHIIFTGNIGFMAYKGIQKKLILFCFFGIIIGVGMHYLYDILLFNGFKIAIIVALIYGYFWISYLFYNSDRIYLKQGIINTRI